MSEFPPVPPRLTPCWACAVPTYLHSGCPDCGAPPWTQTHGPDGVYVIQALCGLTKVGYSTKVAQRVHAIALESRQSLTTLAVLWGASMHVEKWLHSVLEDTRDRNAARDHGLAYQTEWFWPTPALRRLATGLEHMRDGVLWEDPT